MLQSIFVMFRGCNAQKNSTDLRQETPTTMPNPEVLKLQSRDVTSCDERYQNPYLISLAAKVLKR